MSDLYAEGCLFLCAYCIQEAVTRWIWGTSVMHVIGVFGLIQIYCYLTKHISRPPLLGGQGQGCALGRTAGELGGPSCRGPKPAVFQGEPSFKSHTCHFLSFDSTTGWSYCRHSQCATLGRWGGAISASQPPGQPLGLNMIWDFLV